VVKQKEKKQQQTKRKNKQKNLEMYMYFGQSQVIASCGENRCFRNVLVEHLSPKFSVSVANKNFF
jgi:hypothetical protein